MKIKTFTYHDKKYGLEELEFNKDGLRYGTPDGKKFEKPIQAIEHMQQNRLLKLGAAWGCPVCLA